MAACDKRLITVPFICLCIGFGMLWSTFNTAFTQTDSFQHQIINNNATHFHDSITTILHTKQYKDYDMVILVWVAAESGIDWSGAKNLSIISNISDKMHQKVLITTDKSLRPFANALVFHKSTTLRVIKQSRKRNDDVYVLYNMESPVSNPELWRPRFLSHFNLLLHYTFTSDIPKPYLSLSQLQTWISQQNRHSFAEKNQTSADVLWIANNCNAKNGRQFYLQQLFKYISVHSLGKCLYNNPSNVRIPPRSAMHIDISGVISKYKFYLAFENSQCQDYITEKLSKVLKASTVPVVFSVDGLPNYDKFLPKHSYINAAEFKSAKELAQYLKMVGSNERLYNEFFDFKSTEMKQQKSLNKVMNVFGAYDNRNKWGRVANAVYQIHKNKEYNKRVSAQYLCANGNILTKYM